MSQLQSWLGRVASSSGRRSAGGGAGRGARAPPGAPRGCGTSCAPSRGSGLRRAAWRRPAAGAQVDEARLVQDRQHRRALGRRQGARRARPRPRRRGLRAAAPVVGRRAARRRPRTCGATPSRGPDLARASPSRRLAVERGPQQRRHFFLDLHQGLRALRALAPLARSRAPAPRSSCRADRAAIAFGPRFFGASPSSSPRSRAARHVVRCEEYSPSRRSSAPIAPAVVQRSASRTIRRLYSAVKRRRCAFATTSVSAAARRRGLGRRRAGRENSSRPTGSFRFPGRLTHQLLLHHLHPSLPPRPLQ